MNSSGESGRDDVGRRLDLHGRQDLRSLALHRAAVEELIAHPDRVQVVLDVLLLPGTY